ncbi:MAG: tetratricopeptide repeat protein [Thermodesulfobacteriota bacterium]
MTHTFSAILVVGLVLLTGPVWAEDYLDHFDQGEFALRVQNWKRAVEHFTRSIEANPRFVIAYVNRAIANSKMGNYDKSIEDLKEAAQINPNLPDVYGLMGLVYEIKKDYPAAVAAYQDALARETRPAVRSVIERYIKDLEPKLKK